MDGNRGAKGSIKDRLISLLYRLRYAKKVKKEEEYELSKKEKQVEYLKKLLEVKETENVDILDVKDKKELENVKFNINYKFKGNSFILDKKQKVEETSKNVGISDVDLELNSIEYKTSELDEKVDLKYEIKKTKNEAVILTEVSTFVKKSKELLNKINTEVESLKELSKEKNQDTKELEERYKKLREKVDKLKKQYDAVKEKYDFSEFSLLESIKLLDNIKDYKSKASLNEMDMMIKVCKKEINKIESVTVEYKEANKVGVNIDNIKEEQNNVKIKFHKSKENINRIDNIEKELENKIKTQEEIIEDMYREAAHFEKITKEQFELKNLGDGLVGLLNIAGGVLTLPFSGMSFFGISLGNTMINRGLKKINNDLQIKKEIYFEYKYTDIAYKINEVKDKHDYTNLIINDNLNEIQKLKANFKKYVEYNKVLPEYDGMLDKINKLEDKLKLQQEKLSKMDKKLEEEKNLNKQKIQKVMTLKENNK